MSLHLRDIVLLGVPLEPCVHGRATPQLFEVARHNAMEGCNVSNPKGPCGSLGGSRNASGQPSARARVA